MCDNGLDSSLPAYAQGPLGGRRAEGFHHPARVAELSEVLKGHAMGQIPPNGVLTDHGGVDTAVGSPLRAGKSVRNHGINLS